MQNAEGECGSRLCRYLEKDQRKESKGSGLGKVLIRRARKGLSMASVVLDKQKGQVRDQRECGDGFWDKSRAYPTGLHSSEL